MLRRHQKDGEWSSPVRVRMVIATFYDDIAEMLVEGARRRLKREDVLSSKVVVPGALEIPPAIRMFEDTKSNYAGRHVGYVALGCVIRGETSHYDIVASESARGLMDLGLKGIAIGNGILTVDSREQAIARANPDKGDKGGQAAEACLALMHLADRRIWQRR